jgi:uncharacterized protein YccT (UPF0319 family)
LNGLAKSKKPTDWSKRSESGHSVSSQVLKRPAPVSDFVSNQFLDSESIVSAFFAASIDRLRHVLPRTRNDDQAQAVLRTYLPNF